MMNNALVVSILSIFCSGILPPIDGQCPDDWTKVGASCYYRANNLNTWNNAVEYCAVNNSQLPIFYNASEFLAFATWWNTITNKTEVWLGITYNPGTNNWSWLNNCTWQHFPSFFRSAFDKTSGLTYQIYYAKYSNIVTYAPTGVDPVPQSSIASQTAETVCYQPLDETTSSCYEFENRQKNGTFLCTDASWWCATENVLVPNVLSATAYGSCFCLDNENTTVSPAERSCNEFNGTLADIRSNEEFNLITTLANIANNAIQDDFCPSGFSYFNSSCFAVFNVSAVGAFGSTGLSVGNYVENYCRTNYYPAHGASLHSFDEQWVLFHLYYSTFGYIDDVYFYLGAYKNDTSINFTYHWYDGSPTDYIPEWAYWDFMFVENNEYNSAGVSIGLCTSGDLCDLAIVSTIHHLSCRVPSQNSTVYPVLISSITSNSFINSQQYNLLNEDKTLSPLDTFDTNPTIMAKVCRKDQNIWERVGSSYYLKTGFVGNFNDSVKLCNAINATLPTFYNVLEYVAFKDWWNLDVNASDVWLGLTYDPNSNNWTWVNNCPWKYFPSFWRCCWDKNCSLPAVTYFAKYSNQINGEFAPTGVEPVKSTSTAQFEVVCFKSNNSETSGCFDFPSEKDETFTEENSFLCNAGNWWCAKDHLMGQNITTVMEADSCFCLHYFNKSLLSDDQNCTSVYGTLADIRSYDEASLLVNLIDELVQNGSSSTNVCPTGFSFFNDSCYVIIKPTWNSINPPGKYANDYCTANLSAMSASMHSLDEHWFLYWLFITTFGYTYQDFFFLGSYKNDTGPNFTYKWYDGTPMDYVPEWGFDGFFLFQNDNYNEIGVGLMILADEGNLGDDSHNPRYFACKTQVQNQPVYPILVSSVYNNQPVPNCNTSCSLKNIMYQNKTFSSIPSGTNTSLMHKLCRKDRNIFTSTTTATSQSISTTMTSSTTTNLCPNSWTQVGASCYNRPNLIMNFTDSVSYCAAQDSTLPIFYNASEYLSFENWWNTITNNTEVWLGIMYDPASEEWKWLNNCTWKHFPAFWRTRWDKDGLASIVYYAKYSNQVNLPHAPTGVEPVLNYLNTKLDVVCYQPVDDSTSGCYEFPFERNNSFLCSTEGWWCATEHSLGQTVSTAVASDSCFCLDYDNVSFLSAKESCNNFNGTLADIRSDDELQMIITLINNITLNEAIQDFMCPLGFSYFNSACFTVLKPHPPIYDTKPGVNADQYCRNNLSAQSASLHSFDEQWFLYHLYLTTMGFTYGDWMYLGAYKNDTSVNFTYHWNDGSLMDYIPEWGLTYFNTTENNEYFYNGIDIVINSGDGKLGDYFATESHPFACKSQILNYPVYPILVSSQNLLNKNKTFSPANPAQNVISKLCRKDRVIAPSTTSVTTVQGASLVTSINTVTAIQTAAATSVQTDTATRLSTTENVPTTSANEFPVNPMSVTEQLVARVISTIGCTWITVTTALSFVANAFLSRKSYSFEQKLRMFEDFLLCLAHILIATQTYRYEERIVCSIISLLLQYIFTSFFMFLTIESLQTYCIYTNVISCGQCMPTVVACFLGLVVPGLFCLPVAAFGFYKLSSTFSCFVNYSNAVCLANVLPILLICTISIVTTESNGMHLFEDLPLTCIYQRHSAIVSKHALFFKIPLTISSWVLMTIGLHYQKFYWFACIFGVNVALGWVCFLSHFIGNEEVKRLFHKLMKKKI